MTPAELQRRVAEAFDAQGWDYDLATGPRLIEAVRSHGRADAAQLAKAMPTAFFQRNRVQRHVVEAVIDRAIGGETLTEAERMPTTIVIGGSNYQLNLGAGTSIVNSNINLGDGTQVVVAPDASKEDVLLAVEAIVRAGLGGDWNDQAAKDLARVMDGRADIEYADVQRVALDVAQSERSRRERLTGFLNQIAT